MSFFNIFQIVFDLIFLAIFAALWFRLNRPAKDDPRLSRGLQLLQSKISVLEDLSDRTDSQVNQVTSILESKIKNLHSEIIDAEKMIQKIQISTTKSLDVAKIFQDKIPHQEIIERQKTMKFIKAAKMAHQGYSLQEIAHQVNLNEGEIEMIAKLNKDELQFSEEDLPEWTKSSSNEERASLEILETSDKLNSDSETPSQIEEQFLVKNEEPKEIQEALSKLGDQFRKTNSPTKINEDKFQIKKVVFPRIEINNNLS